MAAKLCKDCKHAVAMFDAGEPGKWPTTSIHCARYPSLIDGSPQDCRLVRAPVGDPESLERLHVCGIIGAGWEQKEQTEQIPDYATIVKVQQYG